MDLINAGTVPGAAERTVFAREEDIVRIGDCWREVDGLSNVATDKWPDLRMVDKVVESLRITGPHGMTLAVPLKVMVRVPEPFLATSLNLADAPGVSPVWVMFTLRKPLSEK